MNKRKWNSTSEPFGIMLDRAQSRTLSQTAVNDSVDGQEVSHCPREQAALWGQTAEVRGQ